MNSPPATRGRSRRGRLSSLDAYWLAHLVPPQGAAPVLVDVGLGDDPSSTLQWYLAARARWPRMRMHAVDHDADRVAHADSVFCAAGADITVHHGDLDAVAPLTPDGVRVMNVLRSGGRQAAAHARLCAGLSARGVVVEGTSDARGDVLCGYVLRGPRAHREALVFYTSLARGYAPRLLFDHLPRDLRRTFAHVPALAALYAVWDELWSSSTGRDLAARVGRVHQALRAQNPAVHLPRVEGDGVYVVYAPPGGVPSSASPSSAPRA